MSETGVPRTPFETSGVGVIVPYDFALDRELWRWTPEGTALYITRTKHLPLGVGTEQAQELGRADEVAALAQEVAIAGPGVAAYMCTAGSFIRGAKGEREITDAMVSSGFPYAVTTSGALLESLSYLGVTRLAIATPYDQSVTAALERFLAEAGVDVTGSRHLGLTEEIWRVPYDVTSALVHATRSSASRDPQAVFVSCTNVWTYDLIGPLERELGLPILTANLVTMWAALRRIGEGPVGEGRLCGA